MAGVGKRQTRKYIEGLKMELQALFIF